MSNVGKTAFHHLIVEAFFAILPLIVLGTVWSHRSTDPRESFWSSPEISMTGCVLYGLTITRTLQGAVASAARIKQGSTGSTVASYQLLLLVPLIGVIFSVIFIDMSVHQRIPNRSMTNLGASILCYGIIGGHGLRSTERNDDKE